MRTRTAARLHVVIVGSPNVNPGYKLVGNKAYPQIASDYKRGFAVLKSLPCDIFLGAHGAYFGLTEKYRPLEEWRSQRLHRSRRLQRLCRRSRARIRNGTAAPIICAKTNSRLDSLREYHRRSRHRHTSQQEHLAPRNLARNQLTAPSASQMSRQETRSAPHWLALRAAAHARQS